MSHIAAIGPAFAGNASPACRHVPPLAHHKITFLYDYWMQKRRPGGFLPTRRDIDPIEFPDLLPNVFLLNVHDQAPWFSYRLAGAKVSWVCRTPLSGRPLGEGMPEVGRVAALERTQAVISAREPGYRAGNLGPWGRDYLDYQELVLPLGGPDGDVNMLLGIIVVTDPQQGKEC